MASRCLKLSYTVRVEYRVSADPDDDAGMAYAIENALRSSGLTTGGPRGVDVGSIRFEWEDD